MTRKLALAALLLFAYGAQPALAAQCSVSSTNIQFGNFSGTTIRHHWDAASQLPQWGCLSGWHRCGDWKRRDRDEPEDDRPCLSLAGLPAIQ